MVNSGNLERLHSIEYELMQRVGSVREEMRQE